MRKFTSPNRMALVLAVAVLLVAGSGAIWAEEEPAEAEEPAVVELPVKQIKMFAENWKWSPKLIRVKAGTRLRISIQNVDSPHRFKMKAFGLNVPLPENKTTVIELDAMKPGTYGWYCSRPCGNGCPKMRGKLIIEEP